MYRSEANQLTTPNRRFALHIFDEYICISKYGSSKCLVINRDFTKSSSENDSEIHFEIEDAADIPFGTGRFMPFYAIFGVYWLLKGPYLAIVTQARTAATGSQVVFQVVQQVDFIWIPANKLHNLSPQQIDDEERYIDILQQCARTSSLHFAYDYDITHSLQRISDLKYSTMEIAERADQRFCWNYSTCSLFLARKAHAWVVPIAQIHVDFIRNCVIRDTKFDMLYISRRSRFRQGTRFTMRGIDSDGNVANFVETEQICLFHDGSKSSLVQIRGSIPIFWSSPVSMKYAPKVFLRNNAEKDIEACKKHLEECTKIYGKVILINLIDKKKEQLRLGTVFKETIAGIATMNRHFLANVRYVWFDFHHECRRMKWNNLEKLIKLVDDDFQDSGYFATSPDGNIISKQSGVVRTNCMDNLDRTNVVQSLFARRSLLLQVGQPEAIRGNVLDSPFREFEDKFKNVWGNNADSISLLYAGTGALKTDFTRTGKRTMEGVLRDGWNSCLRYILNNFQDGKKQDGIDLLLRRYTPSRAAKSAFREEGKETLESFLTKIMFLVAIVWLGHFFLRMQSGFRAIYWLKCAILETILAFIVWLMIVVKRDGCRTSWKRNRSE